MSNTPPDHDSIMRQLVRLAAGQPPAEPPAQPPAPPPIEPSGPPTPLVELHPDLQRCRTRTPFGRAVIQHPLLLGLDWSRKYATYNKTYALRRVQFDEALAEQRWGDVLKLLEPPFSWQFLWDHRAKLTPDVYWEHLGRLWASTECFYQVEHLFGDMLAYQPEHRHCLMLAEELEYLDSLPARVRIFRGYVWGEWRGWSWTLSASTARYFAHRYDDSIKRARESRGPSDDNEEERPRQGVVTGLVNKEDILGILLRRDESEVIVCPSSVQRVRPYHRDGPIPDTP